MSSRANSDHQHRRAKSIGAQIAGISNDIKPGVVAAQDRQRLRWSPAGFQTMRCPAARQTAPPARVRPSRHNNHNPTPKRRLHAEPIQQRAFLRRVNTAIGQKRAVGQEAGIVKLERIKQPQRQRNRQPDRSRAQEGRAGPPGRNPPGRLATIQTGCWRVSMLEKRSRSWAGGPIRIHSSFPAPWEAAQIPWPRDGHEIGAASRRVLPFLQDQFLGPLNRHADKTLAPGPANHIFPPAARWRP